MSLPLLTASKGRKRDADLTLRLASLLQVTLRHTEET